MATKLPDHGITIADDWKLVPLDARNWELCHRYATKASGARPASDGPVWHRCGRYYSYGTIAEAMLYVADELMKAKAREQAMDLRDALSEYATIAGGIRDAAAHA